LISPKPSISQVDAVATDERENNSEKQGEAKPISSPDTLRFAYEYRRKIETVIRSVTGTMQHDGILESGIREKPIAKPGHSF